MSNGKPNHRASEAGGFFVGAGRPGDTTGGRGA
jgi:hypothetical protein